MSEIPARSGAHHHQEQKTDARRSRRRIAGFALIATAAAVLAIPVARAFYIEDKYALKSPSGIAFSDFRGYEDWSVVSTAKTDVLKAIVANPEMIKAYKAGVPAAGQPFPDGSKIAKIQWKTKKSTEASFDVDVPDVLAQVFVMEKDSKRFLKEDGGWGYAVFNYDAASGKFTPDAKSLSNCGTVCHSKVQAKDYIFHPYQVR